MSLLLFSSAAIINCYHLDIIQMLLQLLTQITLKSRAVLLVAPLVRAAIFSIASLAATRQFQR